ERGCPPERILVLTPSAAAAQALRRSLEGELHRGYEALRVLTALELASRMLEDAGPGPQAFSPVVGSGDRLAMLLTRLAELALRLVRERPAVTGRFEHVLVDDVQELDLAPASLVRSLTPAGLLVAADPHQALRRFRGAGEQRLSTFITADSRVVRLDRTLRCR